MTLNTAIVGCGRVVQEAYIPALRCTNEIEVTQVIDTDAENATLVASMLRSRDRSQVSASSAITTALGEVDLALVALPPDTAVVIVHELIELGTNVLIEKPFSLDVDIVLETQRRAVERGVWIGIVTNYLYRPDLMTAIRLVRDNAIGVPRWVRLHMPTNQHWVGLTKNDPSWRLSCARLPGGVSADKGFHLLYLAEALSDSQIRSYHSLKTASPEAAQVDFWTAHADMDNGTASSMLTSWVGHGSIPNQIEVHGTKASLYVDPAMILPIQLVGDDGRVQEIEFDRQDDWGYQGQFLAAHDSIENGIVADLSGPARWLRHLSN